MEGGRVNVGNEGRQVATKQRDRGAYRGQGVSAMERATGRRASRAARSRPPSGSNRVCALSPRTAPYDSHALRGPARGVFKRPGNVKVLVQSIATGIECGRDCKTSPYKFCTGLSIKLYPQKIGNTDPVRETRLWYNLIGEVVQSLYGLLFEQTSPSIPVAIDCRVKKMGRCR